MRGVTLGMLVGLLMLAAPVAASAEDPPFVGWTALLPGLATEYEPNSDNDCAAGRTRCVDVVIREMERRFAPLASACDHDAIFSLTYLRTTEEYRRTIDDPTFFEDTNFVNHEDAVFARYYFEAYDNWDAGRRDAVPPAWAIAFRAADERAVSAAGNIALGINAHVQRDLPFVLYRMGLYNADGTSRKTDHDKVNSVLFDAYDDAAIDSARRFDPSMAPSTAPGSGEASIQSVVTWREEAWRNAERLASATTDAERALIAAQIEQAATLEAQAIKAAYSYGPGQSSADRDAYCAAHHNDA